MPPRPPSAGNSTGVLVALLFVGLFVYSIINVVVAFFMFFAAMDAANGANNAILIGGAVLLAVIGLGGGLGFGLVRRPWSRGLGLGLAIGWALWSMLSAGVCTGLNPTLYG